jgi:hypothetical protein
MQGSYALDPMSRYILAWMVGKQRMQHGLSSLRTRIERVVSRDTFELRYQMTKRGDEGRILACRELREVDTV